MDISQFFGKSVIVNFGNERSGKGVLKGLGEHGVWIQFPNWMTDNPANLFFIPFGSLHYIDFGSA